MIPVFAILMVLLSAAVAGWVARWFYKSVPETPIKWLPYFPSWAMAAVIFLLTFMGAYLLTVIAWWVWIFYG